MRRRGGKKGASLVLRLRAQIERERVEEDRKDNSGTGTSEFAVGAVGEDVKVNGTYSSSNEVQNQ